jgi:hypothetical protein
MFSTASIEAAQTDLRVFVCENQYPWSKSGFGFGRPGAVMIPLSWSAGQAKATTRAGLTLIIAAKEKGLTP